MNIFVPKYLSINSYGMYKTYALYITYAGFFHLGYADGMYLKYGGKDIRELDKKDLADNYKNFIYLLLAATAIAFIVGMAIHDFIIIAFSLGMFASNIFNYLKNLYQATGEFGAYSRALNLQQVVILIITLICLLIFRSDNYYLYIWIQVIVGLVICLYLSLRLEHKLHFFRAGSFSLQEYKENISSGMALMLGNFSSNVFTGLDRWFVKFLMATTQFALYSFASSLLNLLNVFITPITVSFYNYLCKGVNHEHLMKLKRLVLAWGLLLIAAGFPVKVILQFYLTKYIGANDIIFILFCAQTFIAVIQGIYVNLYKAAHQQRKYFIQMLIMLVIGFATNGAFYLVHHSMEAFAWATLATYFIWFLTCEIVAKDIRYDYKDYLSLTILSVAYIALGYYMNPFVGFAIYVVLYLAIMKLFMPEVIDFGIANVRTVLNKYVKRGCRGE